MDKPKWKSGLEPMAAGKLDAPLPVEPAILPQTHFAAARLLEKKGVIPDAIAQYRKAIAVNHQYVEAYHALAVLLSRVGDHKGAVRTMAQAVKIRPDDPVIQNNYGYLLMHDEAWEKAIEQFNAAVAQRPFFARAHVNRGLCLSKLGRFEEAFDSFRAVLPEADAHYNMGLMYRGQRRYMEANRSFQRVLEIDPSFVAAKQQLAELTPLLTRGDSELMGPPEGIGVDELGTEPAVMAAQRNADSFSSGSLERDRFEATTSPADFWAFQADFDYDLATCEETFLQEALQSVASVSRIPGLGERQHWADGYDLSDGPTYPADFELAIASFDEDMARCAQVYFQEALEAVATADARSARATKSMIVEPGPVERVQPVDWGAAFSELWEELPPDSNDPCGTEAVSFPREKMAFYPGIGFFLDVPAGDDCAVESEDALMSYADSSVIDSAERCTSYAGPVGEDGYDRFLALSDEAKVAVPEPMDPMDALLEIESRIAMERSEQACLEQELGTFASGRWIDTSVASSAAVDIPEMNVRWTTTTAVRRFEPEASVASEMMGPAGRDRSRAHGAGSTTLGMSIVMPPAPNRAGEDSAFPPFEPEGTWEDVPCPEDSDGVRDPRGASAGRVNHLLEILSIAANDKSCWDAVALQRMIQPEVVDASPADWDDRGVAERDVPRYERATLGSRVVQPESRVQRRARPTPRRYRLGKSTTKGMVEPVRN